MSRGEHRGDEKISRDGRFNMKIITIKDTKTKKEHKTVLQEKQFSDFLDCLDLIFFKGEKYLDDVKEKKNG